MKKYILRIPLIVLALLLLLYAALKVYVVIEEKKRTDAPGNAEAYNMNNLEKHEDSPLAGKTILFLGSSVTYGAAAEGQSFVELFETLDDVNAIKEAKIGTTLVDKTSVLAAIAFGNGDSYVKRLKQIDTNSPIDCVVVQLSTNDATMKQPLGEVSGSAEFSAFDTQTVTGAMEWIIRYSRDTWGCPVVFYTGSHYDSAEYAAMVERLFMLRDKWDIGVIDLYTDEAFNAIDTETYALYMFDPIHPTKAGYIEWWFPKMEAELTQLLAELMAAEYRYPSGDAITKQEIAASGTDTCVYILSRQSGEGHDRKDEAGSFRLTETEIANIRLCAGSYERFVLVLNTGAVIDLSPLDEIEGINALIYMNQLGMEGGNALTAVLTGKHMPSGKLPVTWPKRYSDIPFGDEYGPYAPNAAHASYREGIYVGYRYFDSFGAEPRYAFGYGKTFTDFALETKSVELVGTDVQLSVAVTNTGTCSGKEVVQVYVSCPQAGQDKEYQRLAAFGKTKLLAPDEQEKLTLRFLFSTLASYDKKAAETCLEAGDYILRVGNCSRNTAPAAKTVLPERVVLSRHNNLCGAKEKMQKLSRDTFATETLPNELPVLNIDPRLFQTVEYSYESKNKALAEKTKAYLNSFTAEDMVKFCAGTGLFGENKGFRVPSAVGHMTAL